MLRLDTQLLGKDTVIPVDPVLLDEYWPFIIQFIESALEHTDQEISSDCIRSDIANHKRQLWVLKNNSKYTAAVVTQIITTPTGFKIGEISFAGALDIKNNAHIIEIVGNWFKSIGCRYMDVVGRPAFVRLFKDNGFRPIYYQIRRDLDHGHEGWRPNADDTGEGSGIS